MKKSRVIIIALVVLLIISVISVVLNIRNRSAQDRIRRTMINQAYSDLTNISLNLGGLITDINNGVPYDTNQQSLVALSCSFAKLDTILKTFASSFPPKGVGRNVYPGAIFGFDFISYTLTAGTGTANGISYEGITVDGLISDGEVSYLMLLRDDIDVIIASMASDETPPQAKNLTSSRIDEILITFTSKWSFHNENSPYFLLCND